MVKYYVDTCIWLDLFENRKDKFRPLGEWAAEFINRSVKEDEEILLSDIVEDELTNHLTEAHVKRLLNLRNHCMLVRVDSNKRQFDEALRLSKERRVPLNDAFHAVLARDSGAVLITRDRHFDNLQDVVRCKKPEELI